MKKFVKKYLSFFQILIKQLLSHKARFFMLLTSLTISFTILLTFSFVFFKYSDFMKVCNNNENIILVDYNDNIFINNGEESPDSENMFLTRFSYVKNDGILNIKHIYEVKEQVELKYNNDIIYTSFQSLPKEEMCLNNNEKLFQKSLKVKIFEVGSFPQNEDEICLNKTQCDDLKINYKKGLENIKVKVDGLEFKVVGVTNSDTVFRLQNFGLYEKFKGISKIDCIEVETKIRDNEVVKSLIKSQGLILPQNSNDNVMITLQIIHIIIFILTIGSYMITIMMFNSNFKSLIKESEKQTSLLYYLGCSKNKVTMLTLFKICFLGTISFVISVLLSSIIGLIINNQRDLVFASLPLHSLAMINVSGVIFSYVVAIILLVALYYKKIKKTINKLPNMFGGNI